MKREVILTSDGSTSIFLPEWNEHYHSHFGAVQEAKHVFIENGLRLFHEKDVSIMEIGFGTGLNAFITFLETREAAQKILYTGIEAFPILEEEIGLMNYPEILAAQDKNTFLEMHNCEWETEVELSHDFTLIKRKQRFETITDTNAFDLIYFDAFGYGVQPELWSEDIFRRMFAALKPNGILVTYAARSIIKRNMAAAGFEVEKLAGPPGKREMFRTRKIT